jgi:hypothetical protein
MVCLLLLLLGIILTAFLMSVLQPSLTDIFGRHMLLLLALSL